MVEITLLELNLNAEDVTANTPFGTGGLEDDDDDDGGPVSAAPNLKPVAVGAGLLALVLLVVAVRRLLGGEPEPLP
jgi:hypothetical protein